MTPFPRTAFRPLVRYAPDRRPVEVDLSDNTSLRGPHPEALAAVRGAEPTDLARYPETWADGLREALAERHGLTPEDIVTGCGSDDLLDSAFRAAADPGERVRYLEPTFSMVEIFCRMNGLEPAPLERGDPRAPLPAPERLLEGGPAVVYLCSPNNPTGEVLPEKWVGELLAMVGPEGPVVLLDEAYVEFREDPARSLLGTAPATGRLLVLRTLSKAYGLAGLRVGFAAGPPELVAEVEKSRGPYKVSRLAQAAASAALAAEEWVAEGVEEVRRSRLRLRAALRERGFDPLPSGANFLLLPLEGRRGGAPALESLTDGLRHRGIAVRPFPSLGAVGDAVRVSVGGWRLMERFLVALDEVLEEVDG